ncbi:RelA/SpoT domain-containing protein [Vibrio alginolyticus]|uniref:RelA/SpoT domain-containing protein n=1 Tax=Vibrio alginolyticus TaxID=663 RepID=UPI0009BCF596|nr:RelA/SpoT domain-containing protein [Vibrio alginolyticus]
MGNKAYQSQKKSLEYTKGEIDRAAESIRKGCNQVEREGAIKAIQNFREVHLYPLMLMKNHVVRTANRVNKKIIVARRLKRLPTIINKLERSTLDGKTENKIKFTRMQDIGGCRAIVKDLEQLKKLKRKLESSKSVHTIIRTNDYLIPKDSGYGGVHLIYSCFEGSESRTPWTKLKIEVQLRTELQHNWATSLEIIDIVEGLNLKTSTENHNSWRSFFSIAGKLVAHKEGALFLEKSQYNLYLLKLFRYEMELNALSVLGRSAIAINSATNKANLGKFPKSSTGMFLLDYKFIDSHLEMRIRHFNSKNVDNALRELAKSEADKEINISVLLSSEDARNLKKAYPNYFGSTSEFMKFISNEISNLEDEIEFGEDHFKLNDKTFHLDSSALSYAEGYFERIRSIS